MLVAENDFRDILLEAADQRCGLLQPRFGLVEFFLKDLFRLRDPGAQRPLAPEGDCSRQEADDGDEACQEQRELVGRGRRLGLPSLCRRERIENWRRRDASRRRDGGG
ncbi:MAG: hypothetical protein U1E19_10770 [Rhodoblastus sp.]